MERISVIVHTMGIAAALANAVAAHPVYMDHIEHRAVLTVAPENMDLTIELRFNEWRSLSERRRMDTDRDGRVTAGERRRYLRRISHELADAFTLTCGGRPLDLFELYEPKLDFLGVEGISPNHHLLQLYYFARTPAHLAVRDCIEFQDRCWPDAPALWFFSAGGQDGLILQNIESAAGRAGGLKKQSALRGSCIITGLAGPAVAEVLASTDQNRAKARSTAPASPLVPLFALLLAGLVAVRRSHFGQVKEVST